MLKQTRQDDIGYNPFILGGSTGDPVEFLKSYLQCPYVTDFFCICRWHVRIQIYNSLYRPLSMCVVATNNDSPFVILQGCGHDLRGRCGQLVHQNDQRPAVFDGRILIFQNLDLTVAVLDLNYRAGLDKQTGYVNCINKRATLRSPQSILA